MTHGRKGLNHRFTKVIRSMSRRGLLNWIPDGIYLKLLYKARLGRKLDLVHPVTFNEKLQWLKLHNRKPEYTTMVDKYMAKKWVADKIGQEYVVPLLGVWDRAQDIDFDKLPDQFVLKCNHDSGRVVICKDKTTFDRSTAIKKMQWSLKRNGYGYAREWPYKNVPPKVIAEQYLEDSAGSGELTDYKIHCYDGVPKVIQIISNRFGKSGMRNEHYTTDWERLDIKRGRHENAKEYSKQPDELPQLLELAAILSNGIPYVRVDFYIVNHKIYFGELTLFPAGGLNPFNPDYYDELFGSWINLPTDK